MAAQKYETATVAVDPVIFTITENKLKVLLHRREKEPFQGKKELPGGLLLPRETAEQTVQKKLKELVGYEHVFMKQFYTFTDPERDPRDRTVSIGFISLISQEKINDLSMWHDYDSLKDLAFDHEKIIKNARHYLKENVDFSLIKHFMPKVFPLNKLQEVYELLEEKRYDNRNFRKKILTLGIIEQTKQREQNVSHRPALLFHFK